MSQLSQHFNTDEFACKCGCGFGIIARHIDAELILKLESMRSAVGGPLYLTSGARCDTWNEENGGQRNSAHLPHPALGTCRAADIGCLGGARRWMLVNAAIKAGFRRIGIARTFIHVDTASDASYPANVLWTY